MSARGLADQLNLIQQLQPFRLQIIAAYTPTQLLFNVETQLF
jgi:hypothetical protein